MTIRGRLYVKFLYRNVLAENFCQFLGPIFDVGGFFRGKILISNFGFLKKLTLAWGRVVRAIARENPPGGLTCRSAIKKGIFNAEKFSLYFTHLPRSPQWTDLHEILYRESSRGLNRPFQILYRSVEGFRVCAGPNFAILPLLSRSPLTQGCATPRLWWQPLRQLYVCCVLLCLCCVRCVRCVGWKLCLTVLLFGRENGFKKSLRTEVMKMNVSVHRYNTWGTLFHAMFVVVVLTLSISKPVPYNFVCSILKHGQCSQTLSG